MLLVFFYHGYVDCPQKKGKTAFRGDDQFLNTFFKGQLSKDIITGSYNTKRQMYYSFYWKQQYFQMQKALIAALLLVGALSSTLLVSSDPLTTTITNPCGKQVGLSQYHEKHHPHLLKDGKWIWLKPEKYYWPVGCSAVFETLFYSDCPHIAAKLAIVADDHYSVYINGRKIKEGTWCQSVQTLELKLKCGLNNLTISASNLDKKTPGGVAFAVYQDQRKCYGCRENPAAFYNRDTCTCECLTKCPCNKELYNWVDYPVCGCKCNKQILVPCDPLTRFWSEKTCNCECKKRWCPKGYFQDKKTCLCQCERQECPEGSLWNPDKCQCDKEHCGEPQFCIAIKSWDPIQCKCVCPDISTVLCPVGTRYSEKTCQCESTCTDPVIQPYPLPLPLPQPYPYEPYPLPYILPCEPCTGNTCGTTCTTEPSSCDTSCSNTCTNSYSGSVCLNNNCV